MAGAVIADPRAISSRGGLSPRLARIAELAVMVTEAPWTLTAADHERARVVGLSDDDVLHVIALAAYFGHLNRIADATAVALDYPVKLAVPTPDPAVAPWPKAPAPVVRGTSALALAQRAATATALDAWLGYVFERDAPLSRAERAQIAGWVAGWMGEGPARDLGTEDARTRALHDVAELVTLAPWRLSADSYAELRACGFDDAAVFDVCATATTAGVQSRIAVALAALSR